MKTQLFLTLILIAIFPSGAIAQTSAQERAASLRMQLADVERKQTELQTRLQKIEEDSRPENIESSLAGVGSTHPEELREQRRRELETQKKGIQAQLDQLTLSHARLEKAIAEADTQAYQQSARPPTTGGPQAGISNPPAEQRPARRLRRAKNKKKRKIHRRSATHHAIPASVGSDQSMLGTRTSCPQ